MEMTTRPFAGAQDGGAAGQHQITVESQIMASQLCSDYADTQKVHLDQLKSAWTDEMRARGQRSAEIGRKADDVFNQLEQLKLTLTGTMRSISGKFEATATAVRQTEESQQDTVAHLSAALPTYHVG
jgi:hypothetical protein